MQDFDYLFPLLWWSFPIFYNCLDIEKQFRFPAAFFAAILIVDTVLKLFQIFA
jgi:hypothetical protein